jgi:hypothetical protein
LDDIHLILTMRHVVIYNFFLIKNQKILFNMLSGCLNPSLFTQDKKKTCCIRDLTNN